MPRRKRKSDDPIGVGMTAKQMRRKKPINTDMLVDIEPLTDNQKLLFDAYNKGQHIVAFGCAGALGLENLGNVPRRDTPATL